MEGIPFEAQGIPFEVEGTPFEAEGIPVEAAGIPFEVKGIPFKAQGIPFITKGIPCTVKGVPVEFAGVPFRSKCGFFKPVRGPFGAKVPVFGAGGVLYAGYALYGVLKAKAGKTTLHVGGGGGANSLLYKELQRVIRCVMRNALFFSAFTKAFLLITAGKDFISTPVYQRQRENASKKAAGRHMIDTISVGNSLQL